MYYKKVSGNPDNLSCESLPVSVKRSTFAPAIERDAALQTVLLTWWNKRGRFSLIVICTWYLTLAGLRERERIRPREDGWSAFYGSFEKKTFSKKLSKTFGGYDKISYLCIRFLKRTAIVKQAIFEQIYINNTSSTRAGASQINNWKLMIKARRTWVKQKNRQYLFYID